MRESYQIYTDGSCKGNPGPGGWGIVILTPDKKHKLYQGRNPDTTNNQMELQAVIEALKLVPEHSVVELFSDSLYVINGFEKKYIDYWLSSGWKNTKGKPVANKELWQDLQQLMSRRQVQLNWVKGHSGDKYNNLCDKLAKGDISADGY